MKKLKITAVGVLFVLGCLLLGTFAPPAVTTIVTTFCPLALVPFIES